MFEELKVADKQVYESIVREIKRQREQVELIASENFAPLSVLEACGTPLTNKYAEGYPKARWYGGCSYVDEVEDLARERVKELFGAPWSSSVSVTCSLTSAVTFSVKSPMPDVERPKERSRV